LHFDLDIVIVIVTTRSLLYIAVNGTPSQSDGVSLAICDRTVLPSIRHEWTQSRLNPSQTDGHPPK